MPPSMACPPTSTTSFFFANGDSKTEKKVTFWEPPFVPLDGLPPSGGRVQFSVFTVIEGDSILDGIRVELTRRKMLLTTRAAIMKRTRNTTRTEAATSQDKIQDAEEPEAGRHGCWEHQRLASQFYQVKTGHRLSGQYFHWTKSRPTPQCWGAGTGFRLGSTSSSCVRSGRPNRRSCGRR